MYCLGDLLADDEYLPSVTFKVYSVAVHPQFQFSPAADRWANMYWQAT